MKIGVFFKVSNHLLNDQLAFEGYTKNKLTKHLGKFKHGWVGNRKMEIGLEGKDFIRNCQTVSITFDYIKTPRILRNPKKKQRNFLNKYL